MKTSHLTFAALCLTATGLGILGCSGESHPDSVTAAFDRLAGGATVKIEAGEEDEAIVYEGEWEIDGREHAADVDASGRVLSEEAEVAEGDVPEAVRVAATSLLGGEATVEYERKVLHEGGGSVTLYEAEAGDREITLSVTGEILADEVEDEDEGENEDEDED